MASWEELLRRIKARNGAKVEGVLAAESVSIDAEANVTRSTVEAAETAPKTAISQKDTVPRDMKGLGIKNVQSSGGYHSLAQKKSCCLFDHSFLNEKIGNTSDKEIGKISVVVTVNEYNDDDLPIYEATAEQLTAWHEKGERHLPLWQYLTADHLYFYSKICCDYRLFNVGYNFEEHFASFQLDETHYYRLQFDVTDTMPIDPNAGRLLPRLHEITDKIFRSLKIEYRLVVNKIPCD